MLVGPLLHTSMCTSPIAAAHAYILVYVVASNSTSHLFFHQPSLQHVMRSPQLLPTMRDLYVQVGLCDYYFVRIFFWRNLLGEKKSELRQSVDTDASLK